MARLERQDRAHHRRRRRRRAGHRGGGQARGRHRDCDRSRRASRHRSRPRRHRRGELAARAGRRSSARTAASTAWSTAAGIAHLGTIEDTDYATWRRVLAVNLDGTFLGCKHALRVAQARRRRDRQPVVDLRHRGRSQSRGLQCVQGRRAAVDQVGRAARRAPQAAGALQLGASGVPRRADGGRHSGADRPAGDRARPARARHSARPPRRAARRWPTSASICSPTNPASSPAPSSPSTAA